jgi:hypothetical protein
MTTNGFFSEPVRWQMVVVFPSVGGAAAQTIST